MAIAHTYNPVTHDYVSSAEDHGYTPSNATTAPLPSRPWTRLWPRWNGSAWELVEDHRERKTPAFRYEDVQDATEYWLPGDAYDTPARQIFAPGPLPDGALLTRPEKSAEQALADAKEAKATEIEAGYQAAITAIMTMPQEAPTPSDVAVGAVLLAAEDSEGFAWIIEQFADTRAALIAQVEAAATVEEVEAIVVSYAV
ncbi:MULTISPECIES: phage tail protein [unclassified Desulfovibrio]|uniref:phage tail protein n=1 Tax=unclassified Desulfovibrio TaxID=2593640 RepID=UPI0013ECC9AF|nr:MULTISPECIES: phage tail protein [unclassified Desulfovibrio]